MGRVLDLIARLLEAPLDTSSTMLVPRDAIIVLGATLGPGDSLTAPLVERVNAAAALFHAGGAQTVIATGGITRKASRAEADVVADALRASGIEDVTIERESTTTYENAQFTAKLLPPRSSVWLVTQPFHTRRATRLFRRAGLDAHAWHIANSLQYRDRTRAVKWSLREYAAWAKHTTESLLARRGGRADRQ